MHGDPASHVQQQQRRDLADIMVHIPWLQSACEAKPGTACMNRGPASTRQFPTHDAHTCKATAPRDIVTPTAAGCNAPFTREAHPTHCLANLQAIYASCGGSPVPAPAAAPRAMLVLPPVQRDRQAALARDATSGHDMWFAEQLVELSGLLNSEPSLPRVPAPVPAPSELDAQSCVDGSGAVAAGGHGARDFWGATACAAAQRRMPHSTAAHGCMSLEEGSGESEPALSCATPKGFQQGRFPGLQHSTRSSQRAVTTGRVRPFPMFA